MYRHVNRHTYPPIIFKKLPDKRKRRNTMTASVIFVTFVKVMQQNVLTLEKSVMAWIHFKTQGNTMGSIRGSDMQKERNQQIKNNYYASMQRDVSMQTYLKKMRTAGDKTEVDGNYQVASRSATWLKYLMILSWLDLGVQVREINPHLEGNLNTKLLATELTQDPCLEENSNT